MQRIMVIALIATAMALPISAQMRGGGGRGVGGVRGFAAPPSAPLVRSSPMGMRGGTVVMGHSGGSVIVRKFPRGPFGFRSGGFRSGRFVHRGHRFGFGGGFFPFGVSSFGWWPGYAYTESSDVSPDAQVQATLQQQENMIAELANEVARMRRLEEAEREATVQPERAAAPHAVAGPSAPQQPSDPVRPTVLVFRDGSQLEVTNYAIFGDTLYNFQQRRTRKFALARLDLPATIRTNNERGVEFHVPTKKGQVLTHP